MMNTDAVLGHLKAGGFLQTHDREGNFLLFSSRHAQSIQNVLEQGITFSQAFVLINSMDQLYEYVLRFSDLAWDIAAESEKALLIWYDHAKPLPPQLLDEEGRVGLMINRCKGLHPLLQKLGHGLCCLSLDKGQTCDALANRLPLPLETGCRLSPERIMRLGVSGDVKFLKY